MLLPKEIIPEKMNCSILNSLWCTSNILKRLDRKVRNTFYGIPPAAIYYVGARGK
jgi:hypothetical protein